ncbi:MAG TPA: transporter [Cyanobacteria bacterium UBA8156]|jgi:molybdopterin-binding protein|nr:transporter [Cyanobacteria bacterium UBA8156]
MPKKEQGWITFQSSAEERQILEQVCQQSQRSKTEVLRELIRQMGRSLPPSRTELAGEPTADLPIRSPKRQTVTLSARNILNAEVVQMVKGTVNAEVTLAIAPGVELVATITRTSAEGLGLVRGKKVFAVIKSNSIILATD